MLHAGHRVLGQLLAGPQRRARQGELGRHHATDHVYTTGEIFYISMSGMLLLIYQLTDFQPNQQFQSQYNSLESRGSNSLET